MTTCHCGLGLYGLAVFRLNTQTVGHVQQPENWRDLPLLRLNMECMCHILIIVKAHALVIITRESTHHSGKDLY